MAWFSLATRVPSAHKNNANWFSSKGCAGCSKSSDTQHFIENSSIFDSANAGDRWSRSWSSEIITVEHQQRPSTSSATGFCNIEWRNSEVTYGLNRFRNQRGYLWSRLMPSNFTFAHRNAHTTSGFSSGSISGSSESTGTPKHRKVHSSSVDCTELVKWIENNGDTFEESSTAHQRQLEPPSPEDIECLEQLENAFERHRLKYQKYHEHDPKIIYPLPFLCRMAILELQKSEKTRLVDGYIQIRKIYEWFQNTFRYFKVNGKGFKNAVQTTLHNYDCFERAIIDNQQCWILNDEVFVCCTNLYRRRRQIRSPRFKEEMDELENSWKKIGTSSCVSLEDEAGEDGCPKAPPFAFSGEENSKDPAVTKTYMLRYLSKRGVDFTEGLTQISLDCHFCDSKDDRSLFISKDTGHYFCMNCFANGSGQEFLETHSNRMRRRDNPPTISLPPIENGFQSPPEDDEELSPKSDEGDQAVVQFKRYRPEIRADLDMIEQIYGEAIALTTLPQTVVIQLRNGLGLTPKITPSTLNLYRVLGLNSRDGMIFPRFAYRRGEPGESRPVGMKICRLVSSISRGNGGTMISEEVLPRSRFGGIFGYHLIEEDQRKVILCLSDVDAMSIYQDTRKPALAVPTGGAVDFPHEALPYFEQFDEIIIWFPSDITSRQKANRIARKLGESRCTIVKYGLKDF